MGVGGILGRFLAEWLTLPAFDGVGLAVGATAGGEFVVQFSSVGTIVLWTAIASYALLKLIDLITNILIDQQDEIEDLDLSQRGERGYHTG